MKKLLIGLLLLSSTSFGAYKIQTQGVKTSAECIAAGATDATCLVKDSQIYSSGLAGRLDQAITAGTLGSKLTTKGDLQTFSTLNVRLGVGSDGQVLSANSGTATGLAWADASSGAGSIENLIVNPTAELSSKVASDTWTCTNATAAISTGNATSPTHNFVLTATSAGGYCTATFTTLAGRVNQDSYFYYKTTTNDVVLGAYLGANLQNSATLAAKTAMAESSHVTFITGGTATAGTIRVTMPTNGTVVYVDDLYTGMNQNIGSVATAQWVGSVQFGTDCTFSRFNSSFGDLGTDASCTVSTIGNVQSIAGVKAGVVIPNASSGRYSVRLRGGHYHASSNSQAAFRLYDGSNSWGEQTLFTNNTEAHFPLSEYGYTVTSSGALTLTVQARENSSANVTLAAGLEPFFIDVYYFPTSSQTAVTVGSEFGIASAKFGNNAFWSTSSTTPAFPTGNASATFTATNNGITLTSISDGTGVQPGASMAVNSTGWYNACFTSSITNLSNGQSAFARLVFDDTTTIASGSSVVTGSASVQAPITLCGDFYVSSVGSHTVKTNIWTTGGTGARLSDVYGDANYYPTLTIKKLTQNVPQPVIVNSVTIPSDIQTTMTSFKFGGATRISTCDANPCTVYDSTGGITSVTKGGTGTYFINFTSGYWSGIPTCSISCSNRVWYVNSETSSTLQFTTADTSGSDSNSHCRAICHGDK